MRRKAKKQPKLLSVADARLAHGSALEDSDLESTASVTAFEASAFRR
jgi:hypothetical protein